MKSSSILSIAVLFVVICCAVSSTLVAAGDKRQWFWAKFTGTVYSKVHFMDGLVDTLKPEITNPSIGYASDNVAYDAGCYCTTFKFWFNDVNYEKEQRALKTYIITKPSLQQLKANLDTNGRQMTLAWLNLTDDTDGNTKNAPASSEIIPGLKNWMSGLLIGVVCLVVVGVAIFIILSYLRSQDEEEGGSAGAQQGARGKTKQFNPAAQAKKNVQSAGDTEGAPELSYQQAKSAGDVDN